MIPPGGGGPNSANPSDAKPVYGPNNAIIGYEVSYSDGSFDVLSPKEYNNLIQYGTTDDPEEAKGGGGSSVSGSYYIPNALDYLDRELAAIKLQLEAAGIAPNDAINKFNAAAQMISDQLEAQIANITAEQTATSQKINVEQYKQEDDRLRQQANVTRGLELANTRERAGESFMQDFAQYALPGSIKSLNLPLVGNVFGTPGQVPLNQYNPDTVYGIDTMNNVPTVTPSTAQFPTINNPTVAVPNASQYPVIPDTVIPPIDWAKILQAL